MCSFLHVTDSVSADVVVILYPFFPHVRLRGMCVSCIAEMRILPWLSCVMWNCVSFASKLSGLLDAERFVIPMCPGLVSLYPLLKMVLRFWFPYVLFSRLYMFLFLQVRSAWFLALWVFVSVAFVALRIGDVVGFCARVVSVVRYRWAGGSVGFFGFSADGAFFGVLESWR